MCRCPHQSLQVPSLCLLLGLVSLSQKLMVLLSRELSSPNCPRCVCVGGGGQPGAPLLCSAFPAPTPCVEALFPLWTCYVQDPGLSNIHSNFSSQPLNAVTYFSTNVPSLSTNVPSLRGKVILFYTFSAPLGGLGWRGDRWAWQSTLGNPRLPFVHGILTPISLGVFLLQSIPAARSGSPVRGAECLPHAPSPPTPL